MKILFIGNSHTYFNDMPATVKNIAKGDGFDVSVTMIAHGGWFLEQYIEEPEVRFNILFGDYDYVVLQEHTHPFPEREMYYGAVRAINRWIEEAGSKAVIYMTWAKKTEEFMQAELNEIHRTMAAEIGAIAAPVGEGWWQTIHEHPETDMYFTDGEHASESGSLYAAKTLWSAIAHDIKAKGRK